MPTVKLVVIGASGVGKTSLRGQYISGRFSNGYRATIGADFITKTLPHPTNPTESVALQIWDTAGQERFSSLSAAFFRGADAALLMFDVNTPHTMQALIKWWVEFQAKAPLAAEDMQDYCCVVVGNKIDLVEGGSGSGDEPVSEAEALRFLNELVPPASRPPSPIPVLPFNGYVTELGDEGDYDDHLASSQATARPLGIDLPQISTSPPPLPSETHSHSIAIGPTTRDRLQSHSRSHSSKHHLSKSRSHSSSRFYGGTMTTTLTVYHTPSSSLFDVYQSARSSPEPWSSSASSPSSSTRSAATVTPSLFARATAPNTEATTPDPDDDDPFSISTSTSALPPPPPPPARGPKLFFASAKTGAGVSDVFEYIARRVVGRWEHEERLEARRMHIREASAADTVRLGLDGRDRRKGGRGLGLGLGAPQCCSS